MVTYNHDVVGQVTIDQVVPMGDDLHGSVGVQKGIILQCLLMLIVGGIVVAAVVVVSLTHWLAAGVCSNGGRHRKANIIPRSKLFIDMKYWSDKWRYFSPPVTAPFSYSTQCASST